MPKVDYNNISKTFSNSRKNMKWEEIEYFLEKYSSFLAWKKILDVGCGSWRLLEHFLGVWIENINYTWIDASSGMIEEAKKNFQNEKFFVWDMLDLENIFKWEKFDFIFFIASFHHLDTLEKREKLINSLKNILSKNWIVFMTNWALKSEINLEKYNKSEIKNSKNEFWSTDFNIKLWEYFRFYHSFCLDELEYLIKKSWFQIIENRLFDSKKNFISTFRI